MNALKIVAPTFVAIVMLSAGAIVSAAPQEGLQGNTVFENRPAVRRTPGAEKAKTPKPEETETGAEPEDKQVAQAIANYFGASVAEVNQWHTQGIGYGELVRAYALAKLSGKSASELIAQHQSGQGWGEIAKQFGVTPGQIEDSLGRILKAEKERENEKPKTAGTPDAPGKSGEKRKDGKGK